jgi:hypothetical protein
MADVFTRGVDGGAVLVENVRDYAGKDYFTIITYARQGKEFGSVHRNDEILSCGLLRDVRAPSLSLSVTCAHDDGDDTHAQPRVGFRTCAQGKLSAVRVEDQPVMERLMHVHQPIVPISGSASS